MPLTSTVDGWRELEPLPRPGRVLRALMLALALVFALQGPLGLERWAVLRPEQALGGGRVWQLLSYAFLHQGLLHLLFNLFGLWVFGAELERLWGPRALAIYLAVCAAAAGLAHALLDPWGAGVTGASGMVYGLMAAYGLIYRRRRLLLLGLIPVRAGVLALAFGALALFSGVVQSADGTAHFAHLGGMLGGLALLYAGPAWRRLRLWRHRLRMLRHLRRGARESEIEARLDELLGKVSREGLENLNRRERAFLDEASRWLRERRRQQA
jgi:membrane associated rhomboid family serine protease